MRLPRRLLLAVALLAPVAARAQQFPHPATRSAYVDHDGVLRWRDDHTEVALFGANYTLPSSSDFRAAGYLGLDRKRLVDEDMAQFARMGFDALRLSFWGDWENADTAGNLIENAHLDLLDYVIAKARERGIYMLLSPITTYQATWPDALHDTTSPGFSRRYDRGQLGRDPRAIAAEQNYLRQLLAHVDPYTHTALKDEPAILFVEPINEPWHHPEDLAGSIRYIDALADAVRSTGCTKPIFYNVSQDFRIADAIRRSHVQGVTFGWYPTGLNSGHELKGSYLRTVDDYPDMLSPALRGLARIVYEFDSPDLRTGYMYPAMVRTFRAVGAQFATMFSYDMLGTASRNLGWQTHYLNLVYTPRKAMSAVIAAEAMRRLPRFRAYGTYPADKRFGDFRVDARQNLGELLADDAYLYTGDTHDAPPHPKLLRRVAGYRSSPVVRYEGRGIYFLDRIRSGVWRLDVYPDAVPVRDPFEPPNPRKVVTRAIPRAWPMAIHLPDLGASFAVQPITAGNRQPTRAVDGRFLVRPGVYVLGRDGDVDRRSLPQFVGHLRFDEYHAPPTDTVPLTVVVSDPGQHVAGQPVTIGARVVDTMPPDSVLLYVRPLSGGMYRRFVMTPAGAYEYAATIPAAALDEGIYDYAITVVEHGRVTTFPGGLHVRPADWDFYTQRLWRTRVVAANAPLRLFTPSADVPRMAFSRVGDAIRHGLFQLRPAGPSGEPVFHLELPVTGRARPADYTGSLTVVDRIASRGRAIDRARRLVLRARGIGPRAVLHVTLVEHDGMSWGAAIPLDTAWRDRVIPLADLRPARGVKLPEGFPGEWNYWITPPRGRGGVGDSVHLGDVERVQLSLRGADAAGVATGPFGFELQSITLDWH